MTPKPSSCAGCALYEIGKGFQPRPEGTNSLGLAIFGDALGDPEVRDSLPLRPSGPAGAILERTIKRAGFDRQQLSVHSCVRCQPPKNHLEHAEYELDALNFCDSAYTQKELSGPNPPKVILALGNVPLRHFTGMTGKKRSVNHIRGFYLDNLRYPGIPVISTIDPKYIARKKANLLGVLRADFLRALQLAKAGGKFQRPVKNYTCFPPLDAARAWLAAARLDPISLITYDIETVESIQGTDESELRALPDGRIEWTKIKEEFQDIPEDRLEPEEEPVASVEISTARITQIQFSINLTEAIILPFTGDYIQIARDIMALPNVKGSWNGRLFDLPIMRQAQVYCAGIHHDFMDAQHHLQPDLPKGLQFVTSFHIPEAEPWKHLSDADPGRYGGDDVMYLREFGPKILKQLQDGGLWYGYDKQVRELGIVLDGATRRGIPVDNPRRLALDAEVETAQTLVGEEIQARVVDELRNCEPKNGYINPGIALKKIKESRYGLKPGEKWGIRDFGSGATTPVSPAELTRVVIGSATGEPSGLFAVDATLDAGGRWCRLQPFLPNSTKQILKWIKWRRERDIQGKISAYRTQARYVHQPLADLRGMAERTTAWKVPKTLRDDKETTAKVELERLAKRTGDDFLLKIIEHREYGKIRSTYVQGWTPAADGCIHSVFKFTPATGQLGCSAHWTPVTTKRGVIPIRNVQIGDLVWTHKYRWRRVTRTVIKGVAPMVDVKFSTGQVLTCTTDHRLLFSIDEHSQTMDQCRGEHQKGASTLSGNRGIHDGGHSQAIKNHYSHSLLGFTQPDAPCRVQRSATSQVCLLEEGEQQPQFWKEGPSSPTMERVGGRWLRVSDYLEGWKTSVCSQSSDGGSTWIEETAAQVRGPSHRRGSQEQRFRQSGFSHVQGARANSLPTKEGLVGCSIEEINPAGSYEVYDLTVEEDESYETCGVFSHNSSGPNCQNGPSPKGPEGSRQRRLAQKFREMVKAKPGHKIVALDYKAFHVLTTGFEAKAATWMRLARRDMHSFTTGMFIGEPWEKWLDLGDDELDEVLGMIKGQKTARYKELGTNFIRNRKAKPAGLAIGFGAKEAKIFDLNQESFANVGEVKKFFTLLKTLDPRVFKWQQEIRWECHNTNKGFLKSNFEYIRWFHDVYRWDSRKQDHVPGEDHEAVVAYKPSNDAFGIKKDVELWLGAEGLDEKFGFANDIHDELWFHCPDRYVEECTHRVREKMMEPNRRLIDPILAPIGLWCEVEASVGPSWGEMEDLKFGRDFINGILKLEDEARKGSLIL